MSESVGDHVRVPAARCPYCHEEVPRGEEPGVCAGCHALHHKGCLAEHGACAACGAESPRIVLQALLTGSRPAGARSMTLALLATITAVAFFASSLGKATNDVEVGWAILVAGAAGTVAAARRSALAGWATTLLTTAAGLGFYWCVNQHAQREHTQETTVAMAMCIALGLVLVALDRRRPPATLKG